MDSSARSLILYRVAFFLGDLDTLNLAHTDYTARLSLSFFVNEVHASYIDSVPHSLSHYDTAFGRTPIRAGFTVRRR
jgi:hypothetical protein